jgi:hypothetical protein
MSNRKLITPLAAAVLAGTMCIPAVAQEKFPLVQGDFWEVTGVDLKDGGALKYAEFIASEWKENQEFAKSKGWVKDYKIFGNVHAREGEPDLYLVTIRESLVSGAENDKRGDEFQAWRKKTIAQMQAESGNRAEYRTILSDELLQELKIR